MAETPTRVEEERAEEGHRTKKLKSFLVNPGTLKGLLRIVLVARLIGKFVQAVVEFLG